MTGDVLVDMFENFRQLMSMTNVNVVQYVFDGF